MAWTKGVLILLFALLISASATTMVAQPAQIILLRHAEKPADPEDPHLSPAGVKRAERLVSFIMTDPVMSRFGSPVAVFATQSTKHGNGQRTQETVAPLARALKLPVQTPFLSKDYSALAKRILANPAYAGKTVLICWNQSFPIRTENRRWRPSATTATSPSPGRAPTFYSVCSQQDCAPAC